MSRNYRYCIKLNNLKISFAQLYRKPNYFTIYEIIYNLMKKYTKRRERNDDKYKNIKIGKINLNNQCKIWKLLFQ